ncbi:hypothetical protein HDU99_001954 [Rhizoclosmatium hyalinum]|nr:hypothetical protein HDU99_001954 [Rhizoclosmatium hyalinum]
MKAELGVGFQAINERYTSNVTCIHMKSVNAVASNSSLFKTLTTTWTLTPATHLAPLYNASNSKLSLQSHNAQPASYSITSTPTPVSSFPTKRRFTSADLLKTISDEGAKSLLERQTPFDPAQFQKSISKEEQAAQKEAATADHPVCTVDFYIAFEFKSIVYAQVSDLFFNQVSLAMVKSFEERTRSIYGAATPFRQ